MDTRALLLFILTLVLIVVTVGLLSIASNNKRARWLAISVILPIFWTLFIAVFLDTNDKSVALVAMTGSYVVGTWLPIIHILMALVFSNKKFPTSFVAISSLAAIAICVMFIFPGKLLEGVGIANHDLQLAFIPYLVFSIYFVALYTISFLILIRAFMATRTKDKKNARDMGLLIVSFAVAGLIGGFFNIGLPFFNIDSLIWIGPLGLSVILPVSYRIATTNEHFSALKTFLRGLLYCLFSAVGIAAMLAAGYVLLLIGRVGGLNDVDKLIAFFIILVILLPVLVGIYLLMRRVIERLDSDGYRESKIMRELARITEEAHEPSMFFNSVRHTLRDAFKTKWVDVVTFDHGMAKHIEFAIVGKTIEKIVHNSRKKTVYRGELKNKADMDVLLVHDIDVVTPIVGGIDGKAVGALVLSPRRRRFDRKYGETLERIAVVLSPFVQSSVYYEEILGMNDKMKTEIRRKTEKLRENNLELMKVDEMKNDLIAITTHNLRNPLFTISNGAALLLDRRLGRLNKNQRHYVDTIALSSKNMSQVISDMLDATNIDHERLKLRSEPYKLIKLIDDEVAAIKATAERRGKALTFTNNLGTDADYGEMTGDSGRIQQVVTNLLENALFYTRTKIDIILNKSDDRIEFRVIDDGIGVPKDEREKIWGKMYRASNVQTKRPDGTGIGLYVVKNIAEKSGGGIIFDSTEGEGSTFGFWLPIHAKMERRIA